MTVKITISPIPEPPTCKVWLGNTTKECGKLATVSIVWEDDVNTYYRCTEHVTALLEDTHTFEEVCDER